MRDPYFYPDTEVLKNRLGIMDDTELRKAEADYVSLNLAELARVILSRCLISPPFARCITGYSGISTSGQGSHVS